MTEPLMAFSSPAAATSTVSPSIVIAPSDEL
jgi:hypothetical protein